MDKIKNYLTKCSKGDWFILYQLSKNLNRVFFMDFLTTLARTVDPESPARDNEGDEGTRNLTKPYPYIDMDRLESGSDSDGKDILSIFMDDFD